MKKFKEYGLRKLNSILDYDNLMIITKTPTIADDDCYNEADGYLEFILLNEFDIEYILYEDIYIHHYTEDEEYVATYKFRPTRNDREDLIYMHYLLNRNK